MEIFAILMDPTNDALDNIRGTQVALERIWHGGLDKLDEEVKPPAKRGRLTMQQRFILDASLSGTGSARTRETSIALRGRLGFDRLS